MSTKTKIKWNTYLACAYAEGICEGENASIEEKMEAWAYLIETGYCWNLQGFYGRTAQAIIEQGLITKEGKINWEVVNNIG